MHPYRDYSPYGKTSIQKYKRSSYLKNLTHQSAYVQRAQGIPHVYMPVTCNPSHIRTQCLLNLCHWHLRWCHKFCRHCYHITNLSCKAPSHPCEHHHFHCNLRAANQLDLTHLFWFDLTHLLQFDLLLEPFSRMMEFYFQFESHYLIPSQFKAQGVPHMLECPGKIEKWNHGIFKVLKTQINFSKDTLIFQDKREERKK